MTEQAQIDWMEVEVPASVARLIDESAALIEAAKAPIPNRNWKLMQAEDMLLKALRKQPQNLQAQKNIGVCLKLQGRFREAEEYARAAVEQNMFDPEAMMNLGGCLEKLGRLDEAMDCFKATTILAPEIKDAFYNMGLMLMLQGQYEEGWNLYGHRWTTKNRMPPEVAAKCWKGKDWQDFDGKDVVLTGEQGIGDCIQFARFIPAFRERCRPARLRVVVPHAMRPLMMMIEGVDGVVEGGERWGCDITYPYFELIRDLEFRNAPYLPIPLTGQKSRRVGICWKGNPDHPNDAFRSIHKRQLLDVLGDVPGVEWISFQHGEETPTWAGARKPGSLIGLAEDLSTLRCLVSIDSGPAHIAGAMGLPVKLLVPFSPDWRWEVGRKDSRWYPGHELFRQQQPEEGWGPVLGVLADNLRKEFA